MADDAAEVLADRGDVPVNVDLLSLGRDLDLAKPVTPSLSLALLPQPGGFECLLPHEETVDPYDLPAVYLEVHGELLVELDVAGPASHLGAT
jgi:hypothetical protein